jgi:3-oxoacyl-[acyl-carrier-protein] synthase-1
VLVCSEQGASQLPVPPAVVTRGIGHAMEANRIKTRTVCTGEGLTAAFRQALDGLSGGARITDVYCDMNGEPYRADEFGFACLRTKEFFQSASDFRAAADCWGDVSAASVPLGIAQAVQAGIRGYANGAHALVWASSETGDRGAVVLETPWSATAA